MMIVWLSLHPSDSLEATGNPMATQYYKRHFDEPRTEQSEVW